MATAIPAVEPPGTYSTKPPFLTACLNGDVDRINALAEAGCDTSETTSEGMTGLMLAAQGGSGAAVKAVLRLGGVAALEARDNCEYTALLWACVEGSAEVIIMLAEAGCDTAVTNSKGHTALMLAAFTGSVAAVRAVLGLGGARAALEARDNHGYTAFLWACFEGNVEFIAVLAEAGCDTAATDNAGRTALMLAAEDGSAAAHTVVGRVE